ncbi:MAG: hypothetical protein KF886_00815 [Candidatus Hydrogenedentes bacterium]|nr:hypothetical protein [Candidatus Hydrogenedentota bacterium]
MSKSTDARPLAASLYYIPCTLRVPLKFGAAVSTHIQCARVRIEVAGRDRRRASGWGETPLSANWVWPSALPYAEREAALMAFSELLAAAWADFDVYGHPIEVGQAFLHDRLPALVAEFNAERGGEPMPWLAALVCCSAYDIALHDAYGNLNDAPTYATYNAQYMNRDLSAWLAPAENSDVSFAGKYPADFLIRPAKMELPAWHLVGGKDPLDPFEPDIEMPKDNYPVFLREWIRTDGLMCLKIKLCGTDAAWDYKRIVDVGAIAIEEGVVWLTTDFNCTVTDPTYVNVILDRLIMEHPRICGMLLYVEQPFPYDLEANRIDVHSVSSRKPLFMDESAHDWELVRLGRSLGWTGVALKTCKTQTGALLSLCWAKAHGMTLMVQDLTNPMIAQIPHVLLAAHAGTIMGVETNAMQFYPDASLPEAKVHPGLYRRREGVVRLDSIAGSGFGYRLDEIDRNLPEPAVEIGDN